MLSGRIFQLRRRCLTNCAAAEELSRFVWSAKWLRDIEPEAAKAQNMTLAQLMVRAGTAAYEVAASAYPSSAHWLIVVGTGNNGGDGYVMAKLAKKAGRHVTVLAVPGKDKTALPIEAATAKAAWEAVGGTHVVYDASAPFPVALTGAGGDVSSLIPPVDLIVDGLLGTGITGAPRASYATLIEQINSMPVPRFAIDIPSGLNAETGEVAGACVKAAHTVSFISLKPGLLTGQARAYTGHLHYDTLGLEKWLAEKAHLGSATSRRLCALDLPKFFGRPRLETAHKGNNGKVLLIGGDSGFGGAIIMAAESCLASGAGLTRVLTHSAHVGPMLARCPEIMVEGSKENEKALVAQLRAALSWCTVIAVGPGLGTSPEFGVVLMKEVIAHAKVNPDKPLIVDADGLNVLAILKNSQDSDTIFQAGRLGLQKSVITPHPGEAARLLQCPISEIEKDRTTAARRLSELVGGICLLKGPGTIVYENSSNSDLVSTEIHGPQEGNVLPKEVSEGGTADAAPPYGIIDAGNASMAVGGSGDILTGIVAGLAGQKMIPISSGNLRSFGAHDSDAPHASTEVHPSWPIAGGASSLFHAVCAGALVHSVAADLAAEAIPFSGSSNVGHCDKPHATRGLRPTLWIPYISQCVNCTEGK